MGWEVDHKHEITFRRTAVLLNCGFASGLLQAFTFNPWDRALYLSVKNNRPFLIKANFEKPFAGVTQTVVQRAISSGLYFPLEEIFSTLMNASEEKDEKIRLWKLFFAGTVAGAINGIVMNPFTRIKYHFWGKSQSEGLQFLNTAKEIFRQGGVRHFFLGANATVHRDLVFGGVFALLRHTLKSDRERKKTGFTVNVIAGCFATILSSPLNYIRNVHYATPPSQNPDPARKIIQDLFKDAWKETTTTQKFVYIQSRLRLGWGTARVGCGMAFGAKVYEYLASVF